MKKWMDIYTHHFIYLLIITIGVVIFFSPWLAFLCLVLLAVVLTYKLRRYHMLKMQQAEEEARRVTKLSMLENALKNSERDKQEFEAFFNAFDGATLYIEDVRKQQFYYSLGVEALFGFTQAQFNQDGRLWHQLVHEEDLREVMEQHRLLFKGVSVNHTFRVIHPTKGEKWIQKVAKPVADASGVIVKVYGKLIDVTDQKTLEHQLRKMAYFDDLTDLPNRKMLDRHIKKALARSKRHGHPFAMMFLDLDDFKVINDELGHEIGDLYLVEITKRLDDCVREEDLIARFGGDEFIVVFEETEQQEIEVIATRILDSLQSPVFIKEHELKVSASIGVSLYPEHGETKEALIRRADQAMYAAKHDGKNHYQVYHQGLEDVETEDEGIFKKWFQALFSNN